MATEDGLFSSRFSVLFTRLGNLLALLGLFEEAIFKV
jgi:hypothetical protein